MRDYEAPGLFFGRKGGSWEKLLSDALTNFDTKYVKRRGWAQESAFWGLRNQYIKTRPPFSPKNRHLGPHFDGFNIELLESKRPLIVVGAQ